MELSPLLFNRLIGIAMSVPCSTVFRGSLILAKLGFECREDAYPHTDQITALAQKHTVGVQISTSLSPGHYKMIRSDMNPR